MLFNGLFSKPDIVFFCKFALFIFNYHTMVDFILWVIVIYFAFRLIGKYLLPLIIKYYIKRFQQKFYQQNPHINPDRKEGQTNIDFSQKRKSNRKTNADAIGEYVDFEELETK